jgi:uncharacterized protein
MLERLRATLAQSDRLLVAFSGGADSALLAAVAHDVLGSRAVAVTAISASLPADERRAARAFTRSLGLAHVEVCTDELDRPEYVANDGNRCYHCKSALFDALAPIAALSGAQIALGTNLDDLGEHRPGQAAARQRGVIAPLVEAGLSKADVRALSRELGLVTADKPAAACLSSRIAYGDAVTPEVLKRVERADLAVRSFGFSGGRVRAHANGTVARIELAEADLARALEVRETLTAAVRDVGFTFVSLDLAGFRSGSMNALLSLSATRRAG